MILMLLNRPSHYHLGWIFAVKSLLIRFGYQDIVLSLMGWMLITSVFEIEEAGLANLSPATTIFHRTTFSLLYLCGHVVVFISCVLELGSLGAKKGRSSIRK